MNHRRPIPLFPQPPDPPPSPRQTRSKSPTLLSDGFPPIRIIRTPSPERPVPSTSIRRSPVRSQQPRTGLGNKNLVNITLDRYVSECHAKVRVYAVKFVHADN